MFTQKTTQKTILIVETLFQIRIKHTKIEFGVAFNSATLWDQVLQDNAQPLVTGKKTGNALQGVPYELIAHGDEDSCEIVWF